jgi:hypothetical protein
MNRKLVAAMAVVALLAGGASADLTGNIFVNWTSDGFIYEFGGLPTSTFVGTVLAQLLWSANDPVASGYMANYAGPGGTDISGNEVVLAEVTADFGNFPASPLGDAGPPAVPGPEFGDGDVGSVDIHNGYLYSRIFDGDTVANSMYYYQHTDIKTPMLTEYDDQLPGSVIDLQASELNANFGHEVDTAIVPEPGTMALFGLGLVTLALRQRRRR